ncbi:MAG: uncharacterized protein KVP18_004421 [Porospora cf. gigantea A]|uniref:uncharacterized protein n=1 Tax=Porospora cf. gigantea A TaxID=2853593 RepID=UPI003559FE8D|nr:MAG: hypothetical protein KVP18_004421 [Porospora cf. gigantea A]
MATLTCHSSRGGGELWLGSLRDALDKKFLRTEDIAGVFSILQPNEMYRERQKHIYKAYRIRHWKYPIFDSPNQAIDFKSVNLSKINGFLQSGQSVLIYSRHGAGRAATIVLAYLVIYKNMPLERAIRRLQRLRPQVDVNSGFLRQLQKLESRRVRHSRRRNRREAREGRAVPRFVTYGTTLDGGKSPKASSPPRVSEESVVLQAPLVRLLDDHSWSRVTSRTDFTRTSRGRSDGTATPRQSKNLQQMTTTDLNAVRLPHRPVAAKYRRRNASPRALADPTPSVRLDATPRHSLKPETKLRPSLKPEAKLRPALKPEAKLRHSLKPEAKLRPSLKPEAKLRPSLKPEAKLRPSLKPEAKLRPSLKPEAKLGPSLKPEAKLRNAPRRDDRPSLKPKAKFRPEHKLRYSPMPEVLSSSLRPLTRLGDTTRPRLKLQAKSSRRSMERSHHAPLFTAKNQHVNCQAQPQETQSYTSQS